MNLRKIIFIVISIGFIMLVGFRVHLRAESIHNREKNTSVEVTKNNARAATNSFSVRLGIMADNIKISQDLHKQLYTVKFEKTKSQNISMKEIEDQIPEEVKNQVVKKESEGFIRLEITLNYVYEMSYSYEKGMLELTFLPPADRYKKIVVLDAGHGGTDSGAISKDGKLYEKAVNLKIVKMLGAYLEQHDIKVYYTREEDVNVSLSDRVSFANKVNADLFLSIHCNSAKNKEANGTMAFYSEQSIENLKDAKNIAEQIASTATEALERKGLGTFEGNKYYIVGNAVVPTVLLECAFISNDDDIKYLKSEKYQDKLAKRLGETIIPALQGR